MARNTKVVYKKKYPRAKVMRNRRILDWTSRILFILAAGFVIGWSGTDINVSLWSTAWMLLVGAVLGALSLGGFYLLDVTDGRKKG